VSGAAESHPGHFLSKKKFQEFTASCELGVGFTTT
jgi:hypothetical protein